MVAAPRKERFMKSKFGLKDDKGEDIRPGFPKKAPRISRKVGTRRHVSKNTTTPARLENHPQKRQERFQELLKNTKGTIKGQY